jgi:prepilin-type N-terminal cleavage/methylation domain-containing protein
MKRLLSNSSGFTLLETIIALAIMVVTLASIITVESNSVQASIRARQMNIVAMLARNRMIELEYAIEGKKFDEVKKEDSGDFGDAYKDYRWKTEVKEIKFPALGGSGGEKKEEGQTETVALLMKYITNFLSKAVREISVTIVYKRGGGEANFTVSTYWVDLNREFTLSED